jgi:hypothetical protein
VKQPRELVYALWVDSIAIEGWSRDTPLTSMRHAATGILLEETEDSIVITVSSGAPRGDDLTSFSPLRIPRAAILRLEKKRLPHWLMKGVLAS